MNRISVLGCGWLGLPLAKSLLKQDFEVNGATTSEYKLIDLKKNGINPFLISVSESEIIGDFSNFIENASVLIITIPPKLRAVENENFVKKIECIIKSIEESTIKNVVFTSSTSVYKDENKIVTEDTITIPTTESGKQLLVCEQLLMTNNNFQTTILRFGGLIGEDRHPIKFLAGQKNIENPNAPINLISQSDCISIIIKIIQLNSWNEIFNAVAPFHETRERYYTKKATEFNLEPPFFNHENESVGKTVSSEKLIKLLNFKFSEV